MSNQLRLAAAVVLILITAGYAYYLFMPRHEAAGPAVPDTIVHAQVQADGSVTIAGQRFSDPAKLEAKVAALQQAHPHTSFNLHAAPDMNFGPMGKAALLFQKSGAYKVVFVTEVKKAPPVKPAAKPAAPQTTPN